VAALEGIVSAGTAETRKYRESVFSKLEDRFGRRRPAVFGEPKIINLSFVDKGKVVSQCMMTLPPCLITLSPETRFGLFVTIGIAHGRVDDLLSG